MADTIIIHTDAELEHALEILTQGGVSRADAVQQAVRDAASRRKRAMGMRHAVLRMPLGEPDGLNLAEEIIRSKDGGHW
jgi:hypothetical protein